MELAPGGQALARLRRPDRRWQLCCLTLATQLLNWPALATLEGAGQLEAAGRPDMAAPGAPGAQGRSQRHLAAGAGLAKIGASRPTSLAALSLSLDRSAADIN